MSALMIPLRRICLIDGPLVDRRQGQIDKMAADLVSAHAIGSEREAVRALTGRYPFYDVALLAEDALFAARQQLLAHEMELR